MQEVIEMGIFKPDPVVITARCNCGSKSIPRQLFTGNLDNCPICPYCHYAIEITLTEGEDNAV